jgi:sialate O-acetylesterase
MPMHKKTAVAWFMVSCLVGAHAPSALGAVKPHTLFSDGMVLQQGMKVPVWGTADDNERVTVQFQSQEASTTAKGGKWMVRLENLKAGGPFEMTITASNTIRIKNVLVGEVWICSGQSNMEFPVSACANAKDAVADSKNPMIRLFTVPHRTSFVPRHSLTGAWKECRPDTVGGFTAVGYFFGRDVQKAMGVPVGLIETSWGGTLCEAWTSRRALEQHPDFKDLAAKDAQVWEQYAQALRKYEQARQRSEEAQADTEGGKSPGTSSSGADRRKRGSNSATKNAKQASQPPVNPAYNPNMDSSLYNGMLAPLIPYAIRGATWYQGESNAGRAYQYRTLFPNMIRNWREDWGQGDFPFLFVQLAPWMEIVKEPQESAWAELREAQSLTSLHVPHTGMAVITDLGDEKDIHPRQKEPVGARLALAALAIAYGRPVVYSGPVYESMKVEDGKAILTFKYVGGGLAAKDGPLTGFAIAGDDRKFTNAQAEIRGSEVIAWSPKVSQPVAVRYGWANYPLGNLWNKDGLPASPFRTDDFPSVTAGAQKVTRGAR